MAATLPVLVAAHAGAEVIARLLDRADAAGESAGAAGPDCPGGAAGPDGPDSQGGSDERADAARDEGGR